MSVPLPTLPGVYYARVEGQVSGFPSSNIFTFQTNVPPSTGTPDAVVALDMSFAVATAWATHMCPVMHATYNMEQVSCYPLGSPLEPKQVTPDATFGAATGTITSLSTAVAIGHVVTRRGRGSQSRTYLTPVIASQIEADGRTLVPADRTAFDTAFNAFIAEALATIAAAHAGTWSYVQLSKGNGTTVPGRTFSIESSTTESLLSTQRRRTRRNGG